VVARLLVAVAVAVASAIGCATASAAAQRFIPLLTPGDAIPPIELRAQDGRPFRLADLRGNAVAVSFIYTRCRDARACALVAAKFARAQRDIGRAPIHLVLLTLDPRHDTAAILARYGRAFGQDPRHWTLATGSPLMIDELAERLGVVPAVTDSGVSLHAEAAVVIAPDGRIVNMLSGNDWTPGDLIDYARAALSTDRNPLIAARAWLGSTLERCGGGAVALGGTAMLGILAAASVCIGAAFWLACGRIATNER
jgi:protein SCO1/2